MPNKEIAIITYNLNTSGSKNQDAIVIQNLLNANGYDTTLVHQWSLNETNSTYFKTDDEWEKYDGIVMCGNFYSSWCVIDVIRSGRPVILMNSGYVDDFGLGSRMVNHEREDEFNVVNNTHPITSGTPLGSLDIGDSVWTDSSWTSGNNHADVLVNNLNGRAVLAAHKTREYVYFGWYRMSQASSTSPLHDLFLKAAEWAF